MRSFLGQIGGRKVYGDTLGRQREADGGEGVPHPLLALGHRLVSKAYDNEVGQPRDHLALHLYAPRLQSQIGDRRYRRDHLPLAPVAKCARFVPMAGAREGVED